MHCARRLRGVCVHARELARSFRGHLTSTNAGRNMNSLLANKNSHSELLLQRTFPHREVFPQFTEGDSAAGNLESRVETHVWVRVSQRERSTERCRSRST